MECSFDNCHEQAIATIQTTYKEKNESITNYVCQKHNEVIVNSFDMDVQRIELATL